MERGCPNEFLAHRAQTAVFFLFVFLLMAVWSPKVSAQNVLTYKYNNARDGENTNEVALTPANVNVGSFSKWFTYSVDGYVYSQPLYVRNVTIPGQGTHNVVYVATEHDSVYAFDADNNTGPSGGLLWQTNLGIALISTNYGVRYHHNVLNPLIGITGTPVIDPASGTLYVDVFAGTVSNTPNGFHTLHALNITNGLEQPYSPVFVHASVPGNGVDATNGVVVFAPQNQMNRPALTLAGGILYLAYGSYGDTDPYHGWVIGYNPTNFVQLTNYVWASTPNATTNAFGVNAGEGALWMSGDGPCVDSNNNLYVETANGSFSAQTNGGDYGDSFVKLSTTNQQFAVADYFAPYDQASMAANDNDLGSGGPILLPDSVGSVAHPHLMIGAGKEGTLYLVDRDNLGKYILSTNPAATSDTQIAQEVKGAIGGLWGSAVYFNHEIFFQGTGDVMKGFGITNGVITTSPISKSTTSFSDGYTTPSVSANGTSNAIAWVIQTDAFSGNGPAVLHAYNATNLSQELYNSSQNLSRDNPGAAVKYAVPIVADGKVFVRGEYTLSVFGVGRVVPPPIILPNGGIYTNSVTVTLTDPTNIVAIYYTLDGTTPSTNSHLYTAPFVLTNSAAVNAVAVIGGTNSSVVVTASFINSSSVGSGVGLLGAYYTNHTSANPYSGSPILVRTDAVVNFNWSTNAPDPSVGRTNFTVRWTGSVQPQFNETYTLYATADDGVRLWINGRELINEWINESATTYSNMITLRAQQFYNIEMDYYQAGGSAVAKLQWSSPSTPLAVIPQSQLYPFTNPPPTVILSSPTNGSVYTGTASVSIGAQADAPYNSITNIDFYANTSLVGTVNSSPNAPLYALTVTGLAPNPGYSLTAVATDSSGLSSTSAPVQIVVNPGSGLPYGLTTNGTVSPFLNMPNVIPAILPGSLPTTLSGTGAFSDTGNRVAASGLIPYAPNTPLWSDNAVKSRYMALRNNGGAITPDEQIAFLPTNSWTFPAGTVFVKNFDLVVNETNSSVPLRRLETRLLVRDINGQVYGVTYKWRPDNSDADLLVNSLTEDVLIANATGVRTQTWYYPSPADCLTCHTPVANYILGLNTRQLNGNLLYASTGNTDNQLRTLNRLGLLNPAINEANVTNYEQLSSLTNSSASFEQRARSYLDANCAQCHQPGGSGITFDARYDTPLVNQYITNYPAQSSLGVDNACIVKPRDIWRSMIYQRMNTTNAATKMPPLARNLIDTNAVAVMGAWINSLPGTPALAPPTITPNGGTFSSAVSVTVQPPDTNAAIYYTLDGTLPTTNSLLYSSPLLVSSNLTVTANAFETNFNNSTAASALFVIQPLLFTSEAFASNQVFQMGFSGVAGDNYVLEASTDLVNWTPLYTNAPTTNLFNLMDSNAVAFPHRFYRVLQQ